MRKPALKHSTVVITGASSGIGQAAALAFAREGSNLVLAARAGEAVASVAEDCNQKGARAIAVTTDVTDAESVKQLAQEAVRQFGRIDVWINNAGVGAIGQFTEIPIEAHDQVIRTNLLGCLHGAHAALPYFQRQRSGVLINTNSLGGWVPAPYAVAYTASKFGLRGFSAALRSELRPWPGIYVCDVFPAFIDTPGLRHAANYIGRQIKPLPPVYDAHRVARAMVSLARYPRKEVTVGQSANAARLAYFFVPELVQGGLESLARNYFRRAQQVARSDGNLFAPSPDEPRISGDWSSRPGSLVSGCSAALLAILLARWASHRYQCLRQSQSSNASN